jgi:hypothetical protein
MWEKITESLSPDVIEFLREWLKPALFSAGAALGIQAGLEWIVSPLFVLPVLRRLERAYLASRQILAFAISYAIFMQLHYTDVVQFGPGETGWAKVGLFALIGTAGAQVLHQQFRKRGISNESAIDSLRAAVEKVSPASQPPPDPPAAGGL